MLEESSMDKKFSNRSSQPQSRASAIDCKKIPESTNKPWLRNNKKREGSGTAPKNEPFRKNGSAQRGKCAVDRRPRTRGPPGYNVGGVQITGVEDEEEPEIGSVFVPGSKKQNLNHLLNFMYPSRGGAERRVPQVQARRPALQHRPRLGQDLFLRAYCQFVVKEDGDYNVNLLDPDIPVKWDQIEEIVVRSPGRGECPICLGTPSAGRAGPCGHVYCWPCALHLHSEHAERALNSPPCPVCATPLLVQDMKPTRMVQWQSPTDTVTMKLVRRLRGSTTVEIAPPREEVTEIKELAILPLDKDNNAPYAKFFTATKQQVQEILERERKEIQDQILAEIDTTEVVFMEQALDMLKRKEELLKDQITKVFEPAVAETTEEAPIVYEKQIVNEKKMDWFDVSEEGAASIDVSDEQLVVHVVNEQMADLVIDEQLAELVIDKVDSNLNPNAPSFNAFNQDDVNDNQPEEFPLIDCEVALEEKIPVGDGPSITNIDKLNQAKYFYFYQAEDGQQVFLYSLNVRILNASWGALSAAPRVIQGRVLHRETLPLTEQTRKHMPFTAHLPLYCSFDIVELDLQPPFVTSNALANFSDELVRRAKIRARHEREERRREREFHRASAPPPRPDCSSELLFPPPSAYYDPAVSTTSIGSQESASTSVPDVTPPSTIGVTPPSTIVVTPPSTISVSSPSTSGVTPPSAGPSFAKMASTRGTWRVRPTPQPPPPPAEDSPGAPRALSLSDAIEAALHAAPTSNKKNKKKHKVVFATGMHRSP